MVSTGGDIFLGGIDSDGAIVGYLLDGFRAKTGQPESGTAATSRKRGPPLVAPDPTPFRTEPRGTSAEWHR